MDGIVRWLYRNAGILPPEPKVFEGVDPQILVYAIMMRGLVALKGTYARVPDAAPRQGLLFGGVPVKYAAIDAMQLVMQRSLWLAEGGWYDRSINSDGLMYQEFARKYRVLAVPLVLGEHW
jgi:hypothetical protein